MKRFIFPLLFFSSLCCIAQESPGKETSDSTKSIIPISVSKTKVALPSQLEDFERLTFNTSEQRGVSILIAYRLPKMVQTNLNKPNRDLPSPRGSINQARKSPWPYYLWPNRYDWMLYKGPEMKASNP